jgi:ribosomal protein S18 acetylase RimI-like enzyme
MSDGPRVRAMAAADLDAVSRLAGFLVRLHHAFDPQRFLHLRSPESGYARYFASVLDDPEVVLLVAEDDGGAVVGYAYARLEPRSYDELREACGKLHDVYVDDRVRGRGLGEALVREAVARPAARGAPRVLLLTAVQNEQAQRLFARLGFRTTMLEMTRES